MKIDFGTVVVLIVALHAWSRRRRANDEVPTPPIAKDQASGSSLDSLVSREDWKRRIENARRRAEQARRDWQLNAPLPDPPEKTATERVLRDDTLQPGDIVSTDKGFFQYRGRSKADGESADFVPIAPR